MRNLLSFVLGVISRLFYLLLRLILLLDRTAELRDAQAVLARLAEWTRDVDAHRSALSSLRLTRSDAAVRALRDRKHVLFHHLHAAVQRVP